MPATESRSVEIETGRLDPISLGDALTMGKKVAPDVTLLLMQDHAEAMAYFEWAERAKGAARAAVVEKLCTALTIHMAAEEEILYPAAMESLGEDGEELVEHAYEEHNEAKEIVKQLSTGKAPKGGVPTALRKLREAVEHHVQEEHMRLFPKLRESEMELYAVGRELAARRAELLLEMTGRTISPSALEEVDAG